ncbi:SpoIIE family protein phosphatase [Dermatobacter hominis]|uniref:SpoIIE family protein phosphatase n=1 Tax=Dermatobacter hominis TaxID=2884263 RepID=UPI001D1119FB|nr:SpoIIE family protein phosphatase [Dermatobacter hominis]UDY36097.1 SpoIIE family protein phosphatase [Dermatobacter hominis]
MTDPSEPAWLRAAFDAMLDLVVIQRAVRDPDGTIVDFVIVHMNSVDIDVAGRTRDELIGGRLLELYPAIAPLLPRYVDVVETGRPLVIDELPYTDQIDEQVVSGYYALHASKFGDGLIVVSRDVTEQRRIHRRLSETVDQFEAAQRLANIGVWTLDLATNEVVFSAELRRLFGIDDDAPLPDRDRLVTMFFPDEHRTTVDDAQERMEAQLAPVRFETRIRRADGEVRDLLVHGDVVIEDGQAIRLWGTAQDVSALREAERALDLAESRLQEQGHLVAELQAAILPDLAHFPGFTIEASYFPATGPGGVGGDWYDAFRLPSGEVGLVVGDVAGHGISAAASMAHLRNALRLSAFTSDGPGDALALLNHYATHSDLDVLATVLYAVIDPGRQVLRWAHAGHPPPALCDTSGPRLLEAPGRPPIGYAHQEDYPVNELPLSPGATLVMYTDGLVERRGEVLDVGFARLTTALASETGSLSGLAERLRTALGADSSEDDICVVAARLDSLPGVQEADRPTGDPAPG